MGEDHTRDRNWITAAPPWVLVSLVTLLFGTATVFGASTVSLAVAYYEAGRAADNDPKWDTVADLAQRMGTVEEKVRQHEMLIRALDMRDKMTELTVKLEKLDGKVTLMNSRLEQKGL